MVLRHTKAYTGTRRRKSAQNGSSGQVPVTATPKTRPVLVQYRGALLVGLTAALLLLWVPVGSPRIGAFSDSVEYVILAQQVRGLLSGIDTTLLMATRLPVGFPAWLALADVSVAHATRAHWMNWLAFAWALLAASAWFARELPARASVIVAVLALGVPGMLLIAINPVSESLFAALLMTMLLASGPAGASSPDRRGMLKVGMLAAALLPLVRTAGLPLTLAFAAWHCLQDPGPHRARTWIGAALMLAPSLAWYGWRATLPIAGSYSTSFDPDQLRARFGSLAEFLQVQSLAMPEALARLLDPAPGALAWTLSVVALTLGAMGWWHRWRLRKLDAWLLPPALALLQIWPWPPEYPRMLWPVLPLLAVSVWQGTAVLREHRLPPARLAAPVLGVALGGCLLLAWLPMLLRIGLPLPIDDRPFERQAAFLLAASAEDAAQIASASAALQRAQSALPRFVAPGDCIYASAAEAVWFGSGGRAMVRHFDQRLDPHAALPPQLPLCRYVFAAQLTSPQFPQLPALFPLAQASPWADVVMQTEYAVGGERRIAAALLRQRHWPASSAIRAEQP